eukprot:12720877-Ditylum_brightwellii.AAC.1
MPPHTMPRISDDEVGGVIRDAVEDQQIIGWDNCMKERISIRWKVAQGMFKSAMPNYGGFNRERWTTKVITGIWSIF